MTAPTISETSTRPAPSLAQDVRMVEVSDSLAELARVSAHRCNLQDRLEAVYAERWSR